MEGPAWLQTMKREQRLFFMEDHKPGSSLRPAAGSTLEIQLTALQLLPYLPSLPLKWSPSIITKNPIRVSRSWWDCLASCLDEQGLRRYRVNATLHTTSLLQFMHTEIPRRRGSQVSCLTITSFLVGWRTIKAPKLCFTMGHGVYVSLWKARCISV